jgi:ornithine--oxo-acid transaminase
MVKPIQGEAGVIIPNDACMQKVKELCIKHIVLLIADEVQPGLYHTGPCSHVDLGAWQAWINP